MTLIFLNQIVNDFKRKIRTVLLVLIEKNLKETQ